MSIAAETFPKSGQRILACLALAAAVFIAYGNIYDNVLLFDDNLLITSNEFLRGWGNFGALITSSTLAGAHIAGGFYRPLQMALYFLIYQMSGLEPFSFHLLNVAIHAANACMVFLLGCRIKFNPWAAFLAALIWALHPLHTEVITYATGTAEPLFTFFCLLGLIVIAPDFTPWRIAASIPLFILGLASKESAVVFPALAMICFFLLNEKRLSLKSYLRVWPFVEFCLIAVVYSIWRWNAPGLDGPQSYGNFYAQHDYGTLQLYADHFSWRLYTFFATLPAYLKLLVWPTGLHMERSFLVYDTLRTPWPWKWRDLQPWEGIALITAAAIQIVWSCLPAASYDASSPPRRRGAHFFSSKWDARLRGHDVQFYSNGKHINPGLPLSWGLLWFAAAHFPNTGLVFPMNSQFLEHWMYLPSIGLFLGLAETVSLATGKIQLQAMKPPMVVAALAIAGILGMATFEQNEVWHDPFTFYGNIFKYGEVSPRAHNNLAIAYMDKGDYPAAIAEFGKTIAMTDTYAETRYNLAFALLHLPNEDAEIPDMIANLRRALEIDPHFYRAWEALANIYDYTGDKKNAALCRKKAEENYTKTK